MQLNYDFQVHIMNNNYTFYFLNYIYRYVNTFIIIRSSFNAKKPKQNDYNELTNYNLKSC